MGLAKTLSSKLGRVASTPSSGKTTSYSPDENKDKQSPISAFLSKFSRAK